MEMAHSGPGGGAIAVAEEPAYDLSTLTDEELDALERLTAKLDGGCGVGEASSHVHRCVTVMPSSTKHTHCNRKGNMLV